MPSAGGYLLDTNIVLALIRRNPLGVFLDTTFGITAGLPGPFLISIVTVGELYALAAKFGWGPGARNKLTDLLANIRWVNVSEPAVLLDYADIDAESDRLGRPMGKNDVWIAATARATNTTILTTDRDFDHLHGTWVDREWIDPASKLSP